MGQYWPWLHHQYYISLQALSHPAKQWNCWCGSKQTCSSAGGQLSSAEKKTFPRPPRHTPPVVLCTPVVLQHWNCTALTTVLESWLVLCPATTTSSIKSSRINSVMKSVNILSQKLQINPVSLKTSKYKYALIQYHYLSKVEKMLS